MTRIITSAVVLAAIPALLAMTVIVLALAVVIVPGLLLIWWLDRPQAAPAPMLTDGAP